MSHFLSDSIIEPIYTEEIIPQFGLDSKNIRWNGHSDIGPDATLHDFFIDQQEYMLIYEDYPLLSDSDVHDLVRRGKQITPLKPHTLSVVDTILDFESSKAGIAGMGVTGSFRIYKVK